MSIKTVLLGIASENKCSLDEAAEILHAQVDSTVSQYKTECERFSSACEQVIAENPSVTKESLAPMVAMAITATNPAAFPATLKAVSEYVDLTYVGKRGRRAADDNSVRLSKRG